MEGIHTIVSDLMELVKGWTSSIWILIAIFVFAYLVTTLMYWWKEKTMGNKIRLAPISVKGGISEDIGIQEIGFILQSQLPQIADIFNKATKKHASIFVTETVAVDFPTVNSALIDAAFEFNSSELKVKEELEVKVGPFKIPVGLIMRIISLLPVPFRSKYKNRLYNLSLISIDDETQLTIFRGPQVDSGTDSAPEEKHIPKTTILTKTAIVKGIADFNDLMMDATFMILELNGNLEGRNAQGMRCFTDGLKALDEYRQTARIELLKLAKDKFAQTTMIDSFNYEAFYYYGSMLYFERTRKEIALSTKLYMQAMKTEKPILRAMAKAGLASCYIQQFHRLARREDNILDKAIKLIDEATKEWKEATNSNQPHSLIIYSQALLKVIDEHIFKNNKESKGKCVAAANLLFKAVKIEPDNGMFNNALGWLFYQMANCGIKDLSKEKDLVPQLYGDTTVVSENYLKIALDLNPENKRSHANLSLLYSIEKFRDSSDGYLNRCRYHGLKAIKIDAEYINGYRDLAVALIRYNQLEEAYGCFIKALQLADIISKDVEIINDVLTVLAEVNAEEKEKKRWKFPDVKLLEPPE